MALTDGNILEGAPSSIATPPAGEVTPFMNTDFSPSRFYYKDSTGASFIFPGEGSELEDECSEIMEKMIDKVTCAMTNGNLSMTDFIAFIAQGVTITGISTNDGAGNETCNVTLSPTQIAVASVSSSPGTLALAVVGTGSVAAVVLPTNATNKKVYWICDDVTVATVDINTGIVVGVGTGTANVYCITADGGFVSGNTVVNVS